MSRPVAIALAATMIAACIEVSGPQLIEPDDDASGGTGGIAEPAGGGAAEGGAPATGGTGGIPDPLPLCDDDVGPPCAKVVDIVAGGTFTCAIVDDGTTRCWGSNESGQLGVTRLPESTFEGIVVSDLPAFEQISLGWQHGCGIKDGDVWCWGRNTAGQLGHAGPGGPTPVALGLTDATDVDLDWDGACAVWGSPPRVSCWGTRFDGQTWKGQDNHDFYDGPTEIDGILEQTPAIVDPPVEVTVGSIHACARTLGHDVFCWGNDGQGQLGANSGNSEIAVQTAAIPSPITHLGGGSRHTCALAGPNQVPHCWGYLPQQSQPLPTPFLYWHGTAVLALAQARQVICARYAGGWVRCAGDNNYGQIPVFDVDVTSSQMVLIPDLQDVARLAAGADHLCAVESSGAVWCWGRNTHGQLGRGFTSPLEPPGPATLNP